MTYLEFLLVFLLPPLLVAGVWAWPHLRRPRPVLAVTALPLIALAYTTPWDNYLVKTGVWWYGPDRVLGTLGYVPVEEYAFFLLQPLLAGLVLVALLGRSERDRGSPASAAAGKSGVGSASASAATAGVVRLAGFVVFAAVAVLGLVALQRPSGTYLGLILVWAAPVLALQWAWAGVEIWLRRRPLAFGVALLTVYLWIADAVAIHRGIWTISDAHTTGLSLGVLPVEEATFFLVTNLLVAFGVILFVHPPAPARARSPGP
ncbi:MAG: lycopene cyclase domain-containing protein [Gemmatimonadota bacterium]